MKRTIDQWRKCDPKAMATKQSEAAQFFAFTDAKADILELYEENKRLRSVMRLIAYPKHGSHEEEYNLMDMAKLIRSAYTAEQLSEDN